MIEREKDLYSRQYETSLTINDNQPQITNRVAIFMREKPLKQVTTPLVAGVLVEKLESYPPGVSTWESSAFCEDTKRRAENNST